MPLIFKVRDRARDVFRGLKASKRPENARRMAVLNAIAPCLARFNVIMGGWRSFITAWATTVRKRTAAGVADGIQRLGSPCAVEWHFPVAVDT
ncbi:hypothetical protein H633G_11502 [Metarhizium anisopliae BRIP 53284]|nr:hypothetical protein H633G_11502 [Metarhizium anisopliae BRIP 53284]